MQTGDGQRRLIYTLRSLGLALASKKENNDDGLTFEFLADPETPGALPVLTGHNEGVITVNIAEADDAVARKAYDHQMHEGYRTLLGHFVTRSAITTGRAYPRQRPGSTMTERYSATKRVNYDESLKRHYSEWAARRLAGSLHQF